VTAALAIAAKFDHLSRHRAVASRPVPALFRPWSALRWFDRLNAGEDLPNVLLLGMLTTAGVLFAGAPLVNLFDLPEAFRPWVVWTPTVLMGLVSLRSVLLALRWGPVTLGQLRHIQGWMAQSPALSHAVSAWIRPGQPFLQGDYLAIRHAAAFERRHAQGRSLNEASSPAPQWFATAVNWLHQKPLRAQLGAPIEAQATWGKALADNQAWVLAQCAGAVGASSWPSSLLPQENQRLQELESQWVFRRSGQPPSLSPLGVRAWATMLHAQRQGWGQLRQGLVWWKAWLRPAAWAGVRGWIVSGVILYVAGATANMQSHALELPSSEEAGSMVGQWALGFMELFKPYEQFLWIFALTVGAMSALHIAAVSHPMWRLKKSWWSLPLSPAGVTRLELLLSDAPALRDPFLSRVGAGLTQADLAFVQEASKVLERHHLQAKAEEDQAKNTAAMDSLPAMAAYRARVLEAALPAAQAVPARPRL
jgi:hypothetical protein